jgi:predicted HicB family RNase H-like nuclease
MSSQNAELLETAREIGESANGWADFANALFDQNHGLLAKSFPSAADRAAFVQSDEYRQIKALLKKAQEQSGLVKGATPTKSGKLLVRLPRSMHEALDQEADAEGVSLNQLVVAKLALQFTRIRGSGEREWIPIVVQAYAEVRGTASDGKPASEDRVVADPELDARFLAKCRELGATESDYDLNKKLFYVRKKGYTTHLPKVPKLSIPRERVDQYQYATEMALRFVQKKEMEQAWRDVSLDTIICDPLLAAAFDSFASRIAPGFSAFEYRWAALGLRKAGRYMKDAMALDVPTFDDLGRTRSLKLDQVPDVQGLYLVQNRNERVFIGETQNLRMRIKRHLDVAGPQMIPEWLYSGAEGETRLGVVPLPKTLDSAIKAMELRAILSLTPILNFSRAAA